MTRPVVWTLDRETFETAVGGLPRRDYWDTSQHRERGEDGVVRLVFREGWEYELAYEYNLALVIFAKRSEREWTKRKAVFGDSVKERRWSGCPLDESEAREVIRKVEEARRAALATAPPDEPAPLRSRFWER